MTIPKSTIRSCRSRFIECWPFLFSLAIVASCIPSPVDAQEVYLCVWRNPERTMTKIFPNAKDYRTVTVDLDEVKRAAIEQAIGHELLPGQREQFQYFEMTGASGEVIGTIIAGSQKGEYGAVEFVFGMDPDQSIKDMYIQRSRERDQVFKQREFLDLFRGLNARDAQSALGLFKGEPTPGTTAVIKGLVKELVAFDLLVVNRSGS